MGFLYSPSCVAAWKLAGNEEAKNAAIMAADHLCSRYHDLGKFIQAWGNVDDPNSYRLIIDCLLNIPLLYWTAEVTGDKKYEEIAYNHFKTTIEVCCREDASTYHTYYFDVNTGAPRFGKTAQGAADDSAWARGQSWGSYGPLLTYIYKKDERALQTFKATTNYFLNHLPEDCIPYWDYDFVDGDEPRDSSAGVISACGMMEMARELDDDDINKTIFQSAAVQILEATIDNCTDGIGKYDDGLICKVTAALPQKLGIDQTAVYGDYFYLEALSRYLNPDFKMYW
jgi:unsaturated chondroitin disaccharide hydrolase